jgi:hypothetical protein
MFDRGTPRRFVAQLAVQLACPRPKHTPDPPTLPKECVEAFARVLLESLEFHGLQVSL